MTEQNRAGKSNPPGNRTNSGYYISTGLVCGHSDVCEVRGCERRDTQVHHWAMGSIHGSIEADKWPRARLCRAHHAEWHGLLVRFGLRYPGNNPKFEKCQLCDSTGRADEAGVWMSAEKCQPCDGRGWIASEVTVT